jgi:hypothetical protein
MEKFVTVFAFQFLVQTIRARRHLVSVSGFCPATNWNASTLCDVNWYCSATVPLSPKLWSRRMLA